MHSIDITELVSRNPRVLLLKKEAKALYKKNKTNNLMPDSLTGCQEIVAKKHGYKNWHHFYTTTKNLYNQNVTEFIYSQEPIKDALALGYDPLRGLNLYMPQEQARKHTLILGENFQDIHYQITKQIVDSGKPLVYLTNQNKSDWIEKMKKYSIDGGIKNNIRNISISSTSLIPSTDTFPHHLPVNSEQLITLLGSFFSIHNDDIYYKTPDSILWKKKSNHFISALSNMVCYLYEQNIIKTIDFKTINHYLRLENFVSLYEKRATVPDYVIKPLEYYLLEIIGYRIDLAIQPDSVQEQHGYIHMIMSMTLGTLFDSYGSNFSEQSTLQYKDLTNLNLFITFPNSEGSDNNLLITQFFLLMIGFQLSNNPTLDNMPTVFLDNLPLYHYVQSDKFPHITPRHTHYALIFSYSSKEALTGTKNALVQNSAINKIGTTITGDIEQLPEISLNNLTFSQDILNDSYDTNPSYIAFSNRKIYPLDIIK